MRLRKESTPFQLAIAQLVLDRLVDCTMTQCEVLGDIAQLLSQEITHLCEEELMALGASEETNHP